MTEQTGKLLSDEGWINYPNGRVRSVSMEQPKKLWSKPAIRKIDPSPQIRELLLQKAREMQQFDEPIRRRKFG